MITLRRAASRLLKGEPIVAILAVAVLIVAAPAYAAHSGGGGHAGGGGHSSGGHSSGGHFSGSSHSGGHFSGGFSGRTAHPGQPGFGFRGSNGFRGGFGGFRGGFHGGFYGGFGFYDSFLFGVGWGPWWGPSYWAGVYWPYYWDYPYYPYYASPYPYSYPAYPPPAYDNEDDQGGTPPPPPADQRPAQPSQRRQQHGRMGALDLDISPADTQVYLNGKYIGVVDDFDGWPDYLWLQPGTYDIVFFHEGYKTLARQVIIYQGQRVTYNDRLERGQATRPEDLQSKSHERRDSRMKYDAELEQRAAGDQGDWQNRVRADREHRGDAVQGQPVDHMPATGGSAHLHLSVQPDDASVYLDGHFVGIASELNDNGGGLVVAPGSHKLSVLRPGRKAEEREFQVTGGRDLDVDVKLESN
jgi:hypothetical protein